MTTVTVTAGGPEIADGVYPMYLKKLDGPKTIVPQSGPNAGQDVEIYDWTFETSTGIEIQGTTSTASGPRSKLYSWLTALLGGRPPQVGQTFSNDDLEGKWVLGTIRKNDAGWPRIENLGAMPNEMQQQQFAAATGVPVTAPGAPAPAAPQPPQPVATVSPIRDQVAAGTDDLPF